MHGHIKHSVMFSRYRIKYKVLVAVRRMHLALKAYHELLQTLNVMYFSKNDVIKKNADVIKGAAD